MHSNHLIQLLATSLLVVSASFASAVPAHMWSKRVGTSNPDGGFAVATDGSNNVIFTGLLGGCFDFGGGFRCGTTGTDMFLVKYSANGDHLWSKAFSAQPRAIGVDATGNIYVAGVAFADVDFGGGVLPRNGVGMFLVKFDANGNHQWSKRFSNLGNSIDVQSMDVQSSGNLVIAGNFHGSFDFGGGVLTADHHMFVVKYDANGNHVWSIHHGATSIIDPVDIALDASGNVVVTGKYSYTANFGGSDFTTSTQDWEDIFLAKYDANGNHQWSKSFGADFRDIGNSVDFDAAGNVYFTGDYTGMMNLGGDDLVSTGYDIFLAKYDAAGVHQWSHIYGGTSNDGGKALFVDDVGNMTLAGYFRNSMDLGGGPLTSAGSRDLFVARFDAAGTHQWSLGSGGSGNDELQAIALDGADHVLAAGWFSGTTDFGGGSFTSNGFDDAFLVKYGENPLPVLISRFAATPRGSNVQVEWDISSDEPLDGFTLYRRETTSSAARAVATGDPLVTRSFIDASVEVGKPYEYELMIQAASGEVFRSAPERVTLRASATSLGPNYPNPFNPRTSIEYTVADRMPVTIEIYNVSGSVVRRLEQSVRDAGTHRVEWDGRDAAGHAMGSGVYFYRLKDAPSAGARKMVLLK